MVELEDFFKNWDLPKNRVIVLHSSLKPIHEYYHEKYSYAELTDKIINLIYKYYNPISILIPAYTYAFTKSGVYHHLFSKSESGRFSEESRVNYNFYRTPNPVFSYMDTENYLKNVSEIDHLDAFSEKSVFGYLHHKDVILVNMALKIFLATPIHYIEQMFGVEYRYFKFFPGVLYYDKTHYEEITFEYQVRRLEFDTKWDRLKMINDLIDNNLISISKLGNIEFRWLGYDELYDFYIKRLTEDEQYLFRLPYGELPPQTMF
ncbi:MAG TPA: hypothetical protein PLM49_03665 [Bacteroidales bacterium]|nr:hypothetical protein [Bacteroidales bacterium]